MVRVALAFLLSPIIPMMPFILVIVLATRSLQGAGPFLVVGTLYAYPVMFVIGLPLYIYARSRGTVTFERIVKSAALTGGSIGVVVSLVLLIQSHVLAALVAAVIVGTIGALVGAAIGVCLCAIGGSALTCVGADAP